MTPKTKNIIAWILSGLLALVFLMSGSGKLYGTEMHLKAIESWGFPAWFRFPIGLTEVVFAIGLLMPKFRKLTVYAIFIWTVVAVITHLRVGQTAMIGGPIIFAVVALIILLLSKEKSNSIK